jgi:pimeloyl-ACP methyl ester carboxylesterase
MKIALPLLILLPFLSLACSSAGMRPDASLPAGRVVCFVPGVAGDVGYGGLKTAIQDAGMADLREFAWGSAVFLFNFQSTSIHEEAEKELAKCLAEWLRQKPDCRIDLVGHSAGGGVILGALGRLGEGQRVDHVVLLAPSVSPTYNLTPALTHVCKRLDVFHSDQDTFFLKWRTGTFGTYDNVKTAAAGNLGFDAKSLPAELGAKLMQHPYDPKWSALGNDGGHFGPTAQEFIRIVVAPLLSAAGK